MGLVEWAAAMRKKPLAARRRFVALFTIIVMAVLTLAWFAFFLAKVGAAPGDAAPSALTESA